MTKRKTNLWITAILAFFVLVFSLGASKTVYAASSPKITIKITYDKVNKTKHTETIKLKIKNCSSKKLTLLTYNTCAFSNDDDGGILTYRTNNKKNVTIKAGKTKTVTLFTNQGYISFDKPDSGTQMYVQPYIKYSGKYYRGDFTANKGLNKKLTDGYFSKITAADYKILEQYWTE